MTARALVIARSGAGVIVRSGAARLCAVVLALFLCAVLFGPELAPHRATETVGVPYALPGEVGLLGTDHLGRDVLSRLLHGGRPLVLTSFAAAAAGSAVGVLAGLSAALAATGRRWLAPVIMRPLDAVAAVPSILVVLLILTVLPNRAGLILSIAVTSVPLSARVVAAAAAQVAGRAHLEAAVARGERWPWILGREVLPLIAGPVIADFGMRFVSAVYLVAAAGFLGLSTSDSDWGLLVVEALPGAELQPWALVAPMACVAVIAVGANLGSDAVARRFRGVLS
ncbi:ABC transporter permease [Streptomyces sp. NPDC050485]|uniref:ABC transporter permease n=1 Tax=Streptomyces sp. NPDC050485 TaxID=3365617 RepID=UPI0037AFFCAD